MTGMSIQQYL